MQMAQSIAEVSVRGETVRQMLVRPAGHLYDAW